MMLRRAVTTAAAAVLVATALPAAAAVDISDACPPAEVPPPTHGDVDPDGTFGPAIGCLQWWSVDAITDDPVQFRPGVTVTRGMMAQFVIDVIDVTDADGAGAPPTVDFSDIAGHPHRREIRRLATTGAVEGFGDGTFRPNQPVTRGQMARFIVDTLSAVHGIDLPDDGHNFNDVGGTFDVQIGKLVGADITTGVTATRYEPSGTVTRGQIAAFMARALQVVVLDGDASPPFTPGGQDRWDAVGFDTRRDTFQMTELPNSTGGQLLRAPQPPTGNEHADICSEHVIRQEVGRLLANRVDNVWFGRDLQFEQQTGRPSCVLNVPELDTWMGWYRVDSAVGRHPSSERPSAQDMDDYTRNFDDEAFLAADFVGEGWWRHWVETSTRRQSEFVVSYDRRTYVIFCDTAVSNGTFACDLDADQRFGHTGASYLAEILTWLADWEDDLWTSGYQDQQSRQP